MSVVLLLPQRVDSDSNGSLVPYAAQALKHPWLRTKGSSSSDDADSVASAPFVCSSLPYNDPARSRIGSSAGEDAAMTAVSGTSPAQSHARVDGLQAAQQESGIDSQGFGTIVCGRVEFFVRRS